jgi:hypothetical protein
MAAQFYRELDDALAGFVVGREANRRLELRGGGFIDFWSLENGGDRMRGQKYHRVVGDEAAMTTGLKHIWQKVIRPTLTDFRGDAWFLSTPRRGSDFEELYNLGLNADDPEWASFKVPTAITEDGTAKTQVIGTNNPWIAMREDGKQDIPAAIAELEAARKGSSSQAFAQEYLADFEASDSELVYPEFGKRHIVQTAVAGQRLPEGTPYYMLGADMLPIAKWQDCKWRLVAIDPGGGDPTACYLIGVDKNEHINVYAPEFYRRGDVTPDMLVEFVSKADSVAKVQRITIGETGGNLVTNHFRRAGLPAVKADMAKGEGIEYVRWALQNNLVTVDPKCENMIAEFGMYRWAQKKDPYEGDRYATSIPGDRHGDAMDALRYGIFAIVGNLRGARPMVVEQARQQRAAVR